jgi:hypothetical protein
MIFMNLPYGTTVRLWDYVFCEGYRAIFFVGLSLLRELEGKSLHRYARCARRAMQYT